MPNKADGKLSSEEKQKLIRWLNEKGKNHACPFCGENSWAVPDHLLAGFVYYSGDLRLGGETYPQCVIVCNNCAYTRHFMAVPIGIAQDEKPEEVVRQAEKKQAGGGGNG